jgi:GH25 family lysozyme M1 (1,4-beta-N-acetylmuramidase)
MTAPWKGIDVSYAQGGSVNWAAVKASGVSFAIIRAGYTDWIGNGFQEDSTFVQNVRNAQAQGILVGTYLYVYSRNIDEQTRALAAFHSRMQALGIRFDLPVFLDIEDGKYYLPSTNSLGGYSYRTAMLRTGLVQLKNYGYKAGIYTFLSWANTQFDTQQLIREGYSFWLASWYNNNAEMDPYTLSWNNDFPAIWQYRSTGRVSGISGNVDMNYLYPSILSWG